MLVFPFYSLPLHSLLKSNGWLPEWPNGADCKSAGYAFGGSNPSPPTQKRRIVNDDAPLLRFYCIHPYAHDTPTANGKRQKRYCRTRNPVSMRQYLILYMRISHTKREPTYFIISLNSSRVTSFSFSVTAALRAAASFTSIARSTKFSTASRFLRSSLA